MTVSKIRLNGTDHDIRAKYLIQSTSSDAVSAEFSARAVSEDAIANIQKIYGNTIVVSDNLVSNSATAILSRGFNQWDEQWENGTWSSTGGKAVNDDCIRSTNKLYVLPGSTYYFYTGSEFNSRLLLGIFYTNGTYNRTGIATNTTWSAPANALAIVFCSNSADLVKSYHSNICINISDTSKNGTYEPYNGHQIDLNIPTLTGKLNGAGSSVVIFPNGMQLNGTTRDELTATSAIKRIADDNSVLSTPQTYILDNALQLQYPVVAGGTEMVLPTSGTAPMKMDVIYGNAADATAAMSQNYISVDSMKEFLAALGTQMGGTWSMGYENGKHTFTFTT